MLKYKEWSNIQLTLRIWCRPLSQDPLPPARHQPHLLIPSTQTINHKKAKNPEMRFNSQQIVSYCLGLHTQNPGLREVGLEPSPKRGSDKINVLKRRKRPEESKSYNTAWTHIWIPAFREVDLESSAKRGDNRTKTLVSFYWLFQRLHLKEPPLTESHTNQPRQTLSDCLEIEKIWPNLHILCSSAYQNKLSQKYDVN